MYAHVFKGKFDDLVAKLMKQGKTVEEAKALAAWIGMRKYGVQGFSNLAAAGKVRAANARAHKQENEMTGFAHVFKIGNGNNQYEKKFLTRAQIASGAKPSQGYESGDKQKSMAAWQENYAKQQAKRPYVEQNAPTASYGPKRNYASPQPQTAKQQEAALAEANKKQFALEDHLDRLHSLSFQNKASATKARNEALSQLAKTGYSGDKGTQGSYTKTLPGGVIRRYTIQEVSGGSGAWNVQVKSTSTRVVKEEEVAEAIAKPVAEVEQESVQKYGNGNNQWAKNFVASTTPRAKQINARVLSPSKTAILQAQRGYNTHLSTTGQKHGPDAKLEFLRANQSQQKHIGITALHLTAPPSRPVKKAEGFAGDMGLLR